MEKLQNTRKFCLEKLQFYAIIYLEKLQKGATKMLKRKVETKLYQWKESKYGLLIDGARQIGKTYIIRNFLQNNFEHHVELNLLENKSAVKVLSQATDTRDFMLRLSTVIDEPLIKGKTAIFIDEIQEFKEFDIVTLTKFLVEEGSYRWVFSGSLLGIEQYGINSWPQGYMMLEKMYPLDFEEFAWANGISQELIDHIKESYAKKTEVIDYIHEKFMDIFRKYILVGGMPDAVNAFIETNDFNAVSLAHKVIEQYYKKDVSKYANENEKILIRAMYDLIPSELNSQSKRFNLKDITGIKRSADIGLNFAWFENAGIALPTYNVQELTMPLAISTNRRLVKLFHADVGILTYMMMNPEIKTNIISSGLDVCFGAIYENVVAQMMMANGNEALYYYNKKGIGEIDFLLEKGNQILPIEVKSGKDYTRHSALRNVLETKPYNKYIDNAIVLCNGNYSTRGKIEYLPIYMAMCI